MSGGLGNPQGWNRYSYVENDPVNLTDRTGLQADQCADPAEAIYIAFCIERSKSARSFIFAAVIPHPEGGLYGVWLSGWVPSIPSGGSSAARNINQERLVDGVKKLFDRASCSNFVQTVLQSAFLIANQVSSPDELNDYTRSIYDLGLSTAQVVEKLAGAIVVDGGTSPTRQEADGTYSIIATATLVSNTITMYDGFFSRGATGQAQTALHEAMHLVWGISDGQYAMAAGEYKPGMSGSAASAAWNKKLEENCK